MPATAAVTLARAACCGLLWVGGGSSMELTGLPDRTGILAVARSRTFTSQILGTSNVFMRQKGLPAINADGCMQCRCCQPLMAVGGFGAARSGGAGRPSRKAVGLKKKSSKGVRYSTVPSSSKVETKKDISGGSSNSALSDDEQREAHMATIRNEVLNAAPTIINGLRSKGFAIVDGFLSAATVAEMRGEANRLLENGLLVTSMSTRWDEATKKVVEYEKHNVLATALEGGESYFLSPRLTEYVVAMVSTLPPLINAEFKTAALTNAAATNKLAVCLGDGSSYEKHIDNMGGGDLRKLTVLVYLQQTWEPSLGGCFRVYPQDGEAVESDAGPGDTFIDIEPVGGRLLAFWSDTCVHSVCPSFAPAGRGQRRWALTVWVHTTDPDAIQFDEEAEAKHFNDANSHEQAKN
mmetsp:Transcript_15680/g.30627  ORF Transcript_15680/g.30627 Transcript_15680/m.30627 type:complete len:408 (+) Transcript_15680:24-1247(+)